jgi:hypothetical protein
VPGAPLIPPVVALLADLGLVVQAAARDADELHGAVSDSALSIEQRCLALYRAGAALAALHSSPLLAAPGRSFVSDLHELRSYQPVIAAANPEMAARYAALLALLEMRSDELGDIVVVSHGAAIRLASAVLAGVDANFALDNHLENADSVVLAPITDGRWSCVRWGCLTPPFYPQAEASPVADAVGSSTDPMG